MSKRGIAPIEGRRVVLRLLSEADLPLTLAWRNKPRVRHQLVTSRRLSMKEHRRWFKEYQGKDNDFVFVICERFGETRPVGQVALYGIDWLAKMAEVGRLMIGEESALGKGLAKEAIAVVQWVAFDHFKLACVRLTVFKSNPRAIRIYEQCGFVSSGESDDLIFMELVSTDRNRAHFSVTQMSAPMISRRTRVSSGGQDPLRLDITKNR